MCRRSQRGRRWRGNNYSKKNFGAGDRQCAEHLGRLMLRSLATGGVGFIWTIAFLVVLPFLAVVALCTVIGEAWDLIHVPRRVDPNAESEGRDGDLTSGLHRRRRASDSDIGFSKVKLLSGGRLRPRGLRRRFVGSERVPLSSPPGDGSGGEEFSRSTRRWPRSGKIRPAQDYQADPETGVL